MSDHHMGLSPTGGGRLSTGLCSSTQASAECGHGSFLSDTGVLLVKLG